MEKELKGMIGLEIHTYLVTKEKLFCRCKASREKGLKPNIHVCPICTGQPGSKPMLPNRNAVDRAVQIGLMLGCKINERLAWQRKHYNWPDLPKGYQNTLSGSRAVPLGINGNFLGINISSMHLEEDPAAWEPSTGCVDYNRSGLPLVEIVTAPDFSTAEEVMDWLKKLLHNLAYLKTVDSNAGIKVDVNVSIPGKTERAEIKNMNSIENIGLAVNYELERQAKEGNKQRETRRYDEVKGKTMKMREKEGQDDYRFIRDPDLKDIVLDKKKVSEIAAKLPESPEKKVEKLIERYKIEKYYADILAKNIDIAEFFEKVAEKIDAKFALPWVTVELFRLLNANGKRLDEVEIKAEHFIKLLEMVKAGKITELQAKQIVKKFYPKSFMPENVAGKITDASEIEKFAREAIAKNPEAVEEYKKGDKKVFEFLMGELMKASEKRADFRIAREILQKLLS